MKLAGQVLAIDESKHTSAAAAAIRCYSQIVPTGPANQSVRTISLQPSTTSGEKLTAAQLSAVQSKTQDALKEQVMKVNALKIRQTAAEAASEAETKQAVDQLNTVARVTGHTAEGIPAQIIDTLNRNHEEINNLEAKDVKVETILENNRCNGSCLIRQVPPNGSQMLVSRDKVKLATCVYPMEDYIRLLQCYKCCPCGHSAAHCPNPVSSSQGRICSQKSLCQNLKQLQYASN